MNSPGSKSILGGGIPYLDPTVVYLSNPKYGAALNGTTPDDIPFANALKDVPPGGTLLIPPKPVLLTAQHNPSNPVKIQGSFWFNQVDGAFGDAQWEVANYGKIGFYGGSVLILSTPAGTGLTLGITDGNIFQYSLEDIMLLGPGTAATNGLLIQNVAGCYLGRNVLVANFGGQGITLNNVQECEAGLFKTRGCSSGILLENATNINTLHGWGCETSSIIGLNIITCLGVVMDGFEAQGNTGLALNIETDSSDATFINPLFENTGGTGAIEIDDTCTVTMIGLRTDATEDTITNNGNLTLFSPTFAGAIVNNGGLWIFGSEGEIVPTGTGATYFFGTASEPLLSPGGFAVPVNAYMYFDGPGNTAWSISANSAAGQLQIAGTKVAVTAPFLLTGIPTADPLVAGELWNNGGVINISAG